MLPIDPEILAHAQRCIDHVRRLWPEQTDVISIEDKAGRLLYVPESLLDKALSPEEADALIAQYPALHLTHSPIWRR